MSDYGYQPVPLSKEREDAIRTSRFVQQEIDEIGVACQQYAMLQTLDLKPALSAVT